MHVVAQRVGRSPQLSFKAENRGAVRFGCCRAIFLFRSIRHGVRSLARAVMHWKPACLQPLEEPGIGSVFLVPAYFSKITAAETSNPHRLPPHPPPNTHLHLT